MSDVIRKKTNTKKLFQNQSKTKKQNQIKNMLTYLSTHIRNKLKKNNKCFKCNKKKHISINKKISCEYKKQIIEKKIQILLFEINIK